VPQAFVALSADQRRVDPGAKDGVGSRAKPQIPAAPHAQGDRAGGLCWKPAERRTQTLPSWMAEGSRLEMVLFRISSGKNGTLERCCSGGVP
jgi:hypothetical protein